jgi:hypothetical protein
MVPKSLTRSVQVSAVQIDTLIDDGTPVRDIVASIDPCRQHDCHNLPRSSESSAANAHEALLCVHDQIVDRLFGCALPVL